MGLLLWLKRLFAGPPGAKTAAGGGTAAGRTDGALSPAGRSPFAAGAGPSRLVVLRHCEKSGDKRDPHLSLPGRRRAETLAEYLPATFGRPEFLIAARTSLRSRRPVETLEPLSAALALEIRSKFDDDDIRALIATLREKQRYRGKAGIICWRHSELPRLLQALGAAPDGIPQPWDEGDYTTILDLTYGGNGEVESHRLQMPF